MARILMYTAMTAVLGISTSVFASVEYSHGPIELIYKSTGMELVDRLEVVLGKEPEPLSFHAFVTVSPSEANLVREFDAFLHHAWHAIARSPDEETIKWAVEQLFFIFVKHVGPDAVKDREMEKLFTDIIRQAVSPRHERDPKSCDWLLRPQTAATVH